MHDAIHGLDHDEAKFEEALAEEGSTREEFDAGNRSNAPRSPSATQLLLDAIADELRTVQVVSQNELTERLVLRSQQYGIEPQELLQVGSSRTTSCRRCLRRRPRSKALTIAAVVHAVTVTDTDGNEVDTTEFFGPGDDDAPRPSSTAMTPRRPTPTSELDSDEESDDTAGDDGRVQVTL